MIIVLSEEEIIRIVRALSNKEDEGFGLDIVEKQLLRRLGAMEMKNGWELIKEF